MKKLLTVAVLCLGFSYMSQAQDTSGRNTMQDTSANQAKSMDKKVKNKQGPNGETIYMTTDNRYYWMDSTGNKRYVEKSALKPMKSKQQY